MTASPPSNSALPAAQNVEAICAELQKIAQAKCELMDVDARRQELISELNEFQMQDRFIADTKKTIQELNEERDAHSDIIQQINQDKNDLEKIITGAREEHKAMENRLSRSYEHIYKILEQINHLSKESGLTVDELLDPNSLLPSLSTSLPNLTSNILNSSSTSSSSLLPNNSSTTSAPMSNLSLGLSVLPGSGPPPNQLFQQQQQFLNQLKMNSLLPFNIDPNTAALMNAIASSYPTVSSGVGGLPGSSNPPIHPSVLAAAAGAHQRQQNPRPQTNIDSSHQSPPMKNCQACQQEIHRNAPVCPYCRRRVSSQHTRRSKKAKAGQQKL